MKLALRCVICALPDLASMQEVQAGDKATSATRNSGFRMDVTGAIEKEYISFVMSRPPRFVKDTKNGDAWLSLYVVEGDSVA